jgi:acetyltransferase-like isoleucine patch superfamily enzyme
MHPCPGDLCLLQSRARIRSLNLPRLHLEWRMSKLLLRIRRGDTPSYAKIKRLIVFLLRAHIPVPAFSKGLFRAVYSGHLAIYRVLRRLYIFLYAEPLLRGRCDHVGERLFLWDLPVIEGHTSIRIGDDASIYGKIGISSGRTLDDPKLVIGNGVSIGKGVYFGIDREVTIEDGVHIANDCCIRDNDGHPLDHRYRSAGFPPFDCEVKSVRICRNAWLGLGCTILKGVTVGEGAIIGTRSVVMCDIPPYARAIGNPARIILNPGPPKTEFILPVPNRSIQKLAARKSRRSA